MRILLVEDEPGLVEFLSLELELQELDVDVAMDGEKAIAMAAERHYDLVLLDVILPGISGIEVCRQIRSLSPVPIIMLTARGEIADRVQGLDAGADDYLVKPFAIEELFARIRALQRRQISTSSVDASYNFGDVSVHLDTHRVTFRGEDVELTAREYDLLVFLLRHPGETWSRQALLEHVWGFHAPGDTNVVDVYIGYLRQKVDPTKAFIRTVRGQGYRFEVAE
ncbi:response regulator [Alicyclobacillus dauci]|uniref:Response regulator transcription factor n=1 Tax=Alicyclobacillus dauci TaxID=1475485 RepID=A0ABY6Z5D7_9BACL|nr:response regulator transcription factor [Alicyclobacillus dauci]WAH38097.1 response regulator transcription factor [Alicyclobacillus dauci]